MKDLQRIPFKGDFIDGRFIRTELPDGEWRINSPADLNDEVAVLEFKNDHVEMACEAARKAFISWSEKSLDERKSYLQRLKEIYINRKEELAQTISRETGKPYWEALTEAQAMIGKIDITLNHSMLLVAEQTREIGAGVQGVTRFKPRGAMAVVGPFNFPGHLANGHIVPALATGNTVVFKPSDKTPMTGQLMAECFADAGFPDGVFNLVQGLGNTGRKLVLSENIEGILFTGSYEVGLKIKQETMHHFWKILALEMGGKNATVIWKDADIEKAVYETLQGAYLTSGQRCSCTSRIILHKDIHDEFTERFYQAAKKIKIGHWSEDVFMGPLISADSMEKYIRFQEIGGREGAESMMRGKALETDRKGYYVTPSINIVKEFNPKSVYQKSEIFGPNAAIYKVGDDFDEALKIINSSSYGLAMSVFSQNKNLYERAALRARVGLVNWNRTTNGASSLMPFGGMGKSGNDRPSAHFAVYYCTVPVASLEDSNGLDKTKLLPGLDDVPL